jgi:hypothetical protein
MVSIIHWEIISVAILEFRDNGLVSFSFTCEILSHLSFGFSLHPR